MSVPEYLSGYFNQNQNIHNYNTRRKSNLLLPRVKLEQGKRTFHGAWQFINLPDEIKMLKFIKKLNKVPLFLLCKLIKFLHVDH